MAGRVGNRRRPGIRRRNKIERIEAEAIHDRLEVGYLGRQRIVLGIAV